MKAKSVVIISAKTSGDRKADCVTATGTSRPSSDGASASTKKIVAKSAKMIGQTDRLNRLSERLAEICPNSVVPVIVVRMRSEVATEMSP